jgi:hypothetical protein
MPQIRLLVIPQPRRPRGAIRQAELILPPRPVAIAMPPTRFNPSKRPPTDMLKQLIQREAREAG